MIKILKSNLRTLIWFVAGFSCALLLAVHPFGQLTATATSPSDHKYAHVNSVRVNKPGTRYWSVGVSKDPTHLEPNFYRS